MLKKFSFLFILTIVSVIQVIGQDDKQLVKKCFAGYKTAILEDRGKDAAEFVDSRTLTYYNEILDKTKKLDSAGIEKTNIMDKLTILMLRHRATKEDLLKFDGKALFIYAIDKGMVGKNSVQRNEIGTVKVDGNFASAPVVVGGKESPLQFHFYKENNSWKLDITSIFQYAIPAFKKAVEESGQPENEYLFMLLELVSGTKPDANVWKPLVN